LVRRRYQSALFGGYLYAHFLITWIPPSRQFWVHGALVVAAFAVLPVLPADSWKPDGAEAPGARIFLMLVSSVGLPFIALAGTGPIVQALFAKRFPRTSPYPLYALSNFGSLIALLSFPFVLEPWLSLSATSPLWSGGDSRLRAVPSWRVCGSGPRAQASKIRPFALKPGNGIDRCRRGWL